MKYTRDQLISKIQDYANSYGIDGAIAYEQLRRESDNFRPDVVYGPFVAGAGERGVSQFTPGTWPRFGQGQHTNAYDPDLALEAWGKYMSYLLKLFGYDYEKALQGYNGGEGHVQRGTVSRAAKTYAREILARAGSTPAPIGSAIATDAASPPQPDPMPTSLFGLPLIAIIGGGLLLYFLLDD